MRKTYFAIVVVILVLLVPVLCAAQESISDDSMQASSEDSMQQSSEDSLQNSSEDSSQQSTEDSSQQSTQESSQTSTEDSSANSTENSFRYSTEETTVGSTDGTTDSTENSSAEMGNASAVTLLVGGAVIVVGLTAVGITYLVEVSSATRVDALAFQDQIYAAQGPDYAAVLDALAVDECDLVRANDEVVASGLVIDTDRDAADYLGAIMLKLAEKSPVVTANVG